MLAFYSVDGQCEVEMIDRNNGKFTTRHVNKGSTGFRGGSRLSGSLEVELKQINLRTVTVDDGCITPRGPSGKVTHS